MSAYDITPVSVADYRRLARRRLPHFLFDYIDGGANQERSLHDNEDFFRKLRLRQRVMCNVAIRNTSVNLLGNTASLPLVLGPVGMAGMFRRRGEIQAANAAKHIGVPFTASTVGVCSVEEIQDAGAAPFWFQLYMLRDRDFVQEMLRRAQNAGCRHLVFTVDLPVAGMRLRDFRNGLLSSGALAKLSYAAQVLTCPAWIGDVGIRGKPHSLGNLSQKLNDATDLTAYKAFIDDQFDPSCTWDDIRWLRDQWPGQLIIKGIMEPDDARAAADAGAHAVVVSNHGGRQLDSVGASLTKLPAIAAAVGDQLEVMMDGGVRSGIDVIKAIALGARAVMIGRPWAYALAARGQTGVESLLEQWRREISIAMALIGITELNQLDASTLDQASPGTIFSQG